MAKDKPSPVLVYPDPTLVEGFYLFIPDAWSEEILGVLSVMSRPAFWKQTSDEDVYKATNYATQIWSTEYHLEESEGGGVEDVRINAEGLLEKKIAGVWLEAGQVEGLITDANAESLAYTEEATASVAGGVLSIGVPRGVPGSDGDAGTSIETVTVTMLEAGSTPTGDVTGSELELGIPYPVIPDCDCEPANQGLYALPETTTNDRLCAAAWALARQWSDMTRDCVEAFDFGLNLFVDVSEVAAIIPTIPVFNSGYELFFDELPEIVFNAVENNLTDDDAIALVAEKCYCALQACYPNVEELWDNIDLPETLPLFITSWDDVTRVFSWENIQDWFEVVAGVPDGSWAGYITLFYAKLVSDGLGFMGIVDSPQKIIGLAFNNVTAGDSSECESFECEEPTYDWEQVFDFTTDDFGEWFSALNGDWSVWEVGNGWTANYDLDGSNNRLVNYIDLIFPGGSTLTYMKVDFTQGDMSGNEQFELVGQSIRYVEASELVAMPEGVTGSTQSSGSHSLEWTGESTQHHFVISMYGGFRYLPNNPFGYCNFTHMTIRGMGTNPFE